MVVVLSVMEKAGIVAHKMRTRLPSHKLSEHFGVGSRTIRKFIKNAKDRVFNHGRGGRPSCLDDQSQLIIRDWTIRLSMEHAAMPDDVLLAKIKEESYQTYMRRHPMFINNDRRRKNFISYRSMKTYQQKY